MNKVKFITCIFVVFFLMFSVLPLSAFANFQYEYTAPISRPPVTSNDFYGEFLLTIDGDSGPIDDYIKIIWVHYELISSNLDPSLDSLEHTLLCDFRADSSYITCNFVPNHNGDTYLVSYGVYDSNRNKIEYSYSIISASSNLVLSYLNGSHVYSCYAYGVRCSIGNNFTDFKVNYDSSNDYTVKLNQIISQLGVLHTDNTEQFSKLVEIINGLVQLHSDNVEEMNKLVEILSVSNKIEDWLYYIYDYFIDQQFWVLSEIEFLLMDTNDKLDTIIDLLQPDTDINVSKVDPSNFNEYNKAEQSLLDSGNVNVSNSMDVVIDQNALLYIWPLAERCLNTNPKVIGLVFTILSVSLVALILGRKGGR